MTLAEEIRHATKRATGQTGAAPSALVLLSQSLRGGSMDDLRRAVGLTPSGAVRLVDRLAADGLVERRPGVDLRSVALVPTRAGRLVARRTLAARAHAVEKALDGFSDADLAALTAVVERLVGSITSNRLTDRARGEVPEGGWLCRLCDHTACGRPEGRCPAATEAARFLEADRR